MKRKFGTICMLAGAALILAALSLLLYNRSENRRAEASAEEILPQVLEQIEAVRDEAASGDALTRPGPYGAAMTEVEIDGYFYIGYLSIPALGLELPVMADWSYPQLKIAPCRYAGSTKTEDLVIAVHNYARHFGNIGNLSVGDAVYFTDMDGVSSAYEVAEIDILSPTSVEEMTASGYALTLFTCTYGGANRVTVRCQRAE